MLEVSGLEEFLRGLEEMQAAIEAFPEFATERMETVIRRSLMLLATYAAEYPPPPPPGLWAATTSQDQKAAFFAKGWNGRGGTLGRGWTSAIPQVTISGHVLGARITNAIPYGPYVQGPGQQLPVHRGRWETSEDVVRKHVGEISGLLAAAGYELVEDLAQGAGG